MPQGSYNHHGLRWSNLLRNRTEEAHARFYSPPSLLLRIDVVPERCGGRPCAAGTRLTVEDVVGTAANGGVEEGHLLEEYPELTKDDIDACLLYAVEHGYYDH